MAYNMKSSPAKLGAALRIGKALVKYGKKILYSNPSSTTKQIKSASEKKTAKTVSESKAIEIDLMKKFKQHFKDPVKNK